MAAKPVILNPIAMKLELLSSHDQANMPANFEQNPSKKYFSHFLVAIKNAGCMELIIFSDVFQYERVSRVENITK